MVEPKFEDGVWVCPVCGFKAMSKKVVEQHIQKEHSSEAQSKKESGGEKPQAKKKESNKEAKKEASRRKSRKNEKSGGSEKKGSIRKKEFKIGRTKLRVFDYNCINVKDQRAWLMFQNSNYVAVLHKKRVRVKLITGEEFEGLLKAKDPYFVTLILQDRRLIINKAHILYIEPLERS